MKPKHEHAYVLKQNYLFIVISNSNVLQTVRVSMYWARGKFGEHERSVGISQGAAEGNSSLLSALQTPQVLNMYTNTQLKLELIVL